MLRRRRRSVVGSITRLRPSFVVGVLVLSIVAGCYYRGAWPFRKSVPEDPTPDTTLLQAQDSGVDATIWAPEGWTAWRYYGSDTISECTTLSMQVPKMRGTKVGLFCNATGIHYDIDLAGCCVGPRCIPRKHGPFDHAVIQLVWEPSVRQLWFRSLQTGQAFNMHTLPDMESCGSITFTARLQPDTGLEHLRTQSCSDAHMVRHLYDGATLAVASERCDGGAMCGGRCFDVCSECDTPHCMCYRDGYITASGETQTGPVCLVRGGEGKKLPEPGRLEARKMLLHGHAISSTNVLDADLTYLDVMSTFAEHMNLAHKVTHAPAEVSPPAGESNATTGTELSEGTVVEMTAYADLPPLLCKVQSFLGNQRYRVHCRWELVVDVPRHRLHPVVSPPYLQDDVLQIGGVKAAQAVQYWQSPTVNDSIPLLMPVTGFAREVADSGDVLVCDSELMEVCSWVEAWRVVGAVTSLSPHNATIGTEVDIIQFRHESGTYHVVQGTVTHRHTSDTGMAMYEVAFAGGTQLPAYPEACVEHLCTMVDLSSAASLTATLLLIALPALVMALL